MSVIRSMNSNISQHGFEEKLIEIHSAIYPKDNIPTPNIELHKHDSY